MDSNWDGAAAGDDCDCASRDYWAVARALTGKQRTTLLAVGGHEVEPLATLIIFGQLSSAGHNAQGTRIHRCGPSSFVSSVCWAWDDSTA